MAGASREVQQRLLERTEEDHEQLEMLLKAVQSLRWRVIGLEGRTRELQEQLDAAGAELDEVKRQGRRRAR